jgi:predicted RNase H-like HicB family nuclease
MKKQPQKTYVYPITVEPCEEGGFFASCRALQGCHAEGETFGEVIDNIQEVIRLHVDARKKSKLPLSSIILKKPADIKMEMTLPVQA